MKNNFIAESVGMMAGVTLIILVLLRGSIMYGAFIVTVLMWIAAVSRYLYQRYGKKKRYVVKRGVALRKREIKKEDHNVSEIVKEMLLRHVNFRISAFLQSLYKDASWEWCEKDPVALITNGGTGRIQVFQIPDYNYANITLDLHAQIRCDMVNIVPMDQLCPESKEDTGKKESIDPQLWYEMQGRKVLEQTIADLNSRGFQSLVLKADGEIAVYQSDKEVPENKLSSFPDLVYWPRLIKVLEQEGLAAQVSGDRIRVAW